MRTLKKTLAFVLVLAMVLSLGTIGASAAFTDTDDAAYPDAIDVLSGIGVIDGMGDGTFDPDGSLTRAQAAKIIAYMLLGPANAKLISSATSQKFSDVAVSHWAAGYIEYCTNLGIIAGVGDGKFDPNGTLTTAAFTKMVLCALGYKADVEGLVGESWAINTASLAVSAGITDSRITISPIIACTREQACQIAFKALTAKLVEYVGGSTITVGGVTIVQGATRKDVDGSKTVNYDGKAGDGVMQFCEKYFPKLVCDTTPVNGVEGFTWYLDGTKISNFISTAKVLGTVTNGTPISVVTNPASPAYIAPLATDTDLTTAGNQPVAYFFNGAPVTEVTALTAGNHGGEIAKDAPFVYQNVLYKATATIAENVAIVFGDNASEYSVTGAVVTLYGGTGANANKVVKVGVIEKKVALLSADAVVKTTGAVTKVTIPNTGITDQLAANVTYPDGLVKGDVVLYYQAGTHYYVEKAKSVTGTMGGFSATSVTIDGTKYGISKLAGNISAIFATTDYLGLANVTYYLDNGDNVVYAVSPTSVTNVSNYVFVKQATMSGFNAIAQIVKMDGTIETVTVAKVGGKTPDLVPGEPEGEEVDTTDDLVGNRFYSFTVNAAGEYMLKTTANQAEYLSYEILKNTVKFLKSGTVVPEVIGTAKTVFLYQGATSVTVYTGINNTASYGSGNIYVLFDTDNKTALAVYATGGTPGSAIGASELAMILSDSATTNYVAPGQYTYTYPVVVNGEITTKTFAAPLASPDSSAAGYIYEITGYTGDVASSYTKIENISDLTKMVLRTTEVNNSTTPKELVVNAEGATLQVKSNYFVLNSAVRYFTINTTLGTATEIIAYDVNQLAGASYTVTTIKTSPLDSSISYVFIQ